MAVQVSSRLFFTPDEEGLSSWGRELNSRNVTTTGSAIQFEKLTEVDDTELEFEFSAQMMASPGPGFCWIRNSGVEPLSVGFATGVLPLSLPAGAPMLISLASTVGSLFLQSTETGTSVEILVAQR